MSKTQISISLSDLALSATAEADSRSAFINTLLEAIAANTTATKYIKAISGADIDYKKLVELGIEALTLVADKQRNLQQFTQAMSKPTTTEPKLPSRTVAIRNLIRSEQVATWDELVEQLTDYDFTNIKPPTAPTIGNHKYHYEDVLVQQATKHTYSVNRNGNIVEA